MNHYEVLQVDSGASLDEIREAYRIQLRVWHPDKHDGTGLETKAAEQTRLILEAWRVLRDPASRSEYDRLQSQGTRPDRSSDDSHAREEAASHDRDPNQDEESSFAEAKQRARRESGAAPRSAESGDRVQPGRDHDVAMSSHVRRLLGRVRRVPTVPVALVALVVAGVFANQVVDDGRDVADAESQPQISTSSEGTGDDHDDSYRAVGFRDDALASIKSDIEFSCEFVPHFREIRRGDRRPSVQDLNYFWILFQRMEDHLPSFVPDDEARDEYDNMKAAMRDAEMKYQAMKRQPASADIVEAWSPVERAVGDWMDVTDAPGINPLVDWNCDGAGI